jgi:AcrR family transcriptional regulator
MTGHNCPLPRAPRLQVEIRRERLLALGLRLFSERRYDEVTTDEIATAAGVSKGLLYHYFAGKRGYYLAAVEELGRRLLDATPVDPRVPFFEAIRAALFRGIDFARNNAAFYRALTRGGVGQDEEVRSILETVRRTATARMLALASVVDPPPRSRAAWAGWVGFCEAAILDWLDHGCDLPEEDLVEMMLVALISILSSTGPASAVRH